MNIYLISNNLVLNGLDYESILSVDEKRKNRPLSIEGENLAKNLKNQFSCDEVYSSSFASSLATAKYFIMENNNFININEDLNDVKIGEMNRHNIKMLRYMQDKNFDYKYNNGESLNDAKKRMVTYINKIIKKGIRDVIIFTHKRAIMAYLLNYCDVGYNLEEHLILSYKDKVIIDDTENSVDIIKLSIRDEKIEDINYLEI